MSRKYEFSYFSITFRHFYGGSDNRYDRPIFDNFGPSVPRHVAAPVKLQKRWYFFPDVLCHWSTLWYWYPRCKSNTLRKQASDYTWRPIIDVLLYIYLFIGERERANLVVRLARFFYNNWRAGASQPTGKIIIFII